MGLAQGKWELSPENRVEGQVPLAQGRDSCVFCILGILIRGVQGGDGVGRAPMGPSDGKPSGTRCPF